MENAIFNGMKYTATEISKSYDLEKCIRKASGRQELRCPDLACSAPVLRYCHGEIRNPFFAHFTNCACDYAKFDRENTCLMRKVQRAIYEHLTSCGVNVQMEVKLLPHHYTHLLLLMSNGKKIAIELGTQKTPVNKIDVVSEQYKRLSIGVKWIVISDNKVLVKENETYFIKRYLLNESKWKDVLILNWEGTEVTQYIVDPNEYSYNGIKIQSANYPKIYSESKALSELTLENGEVTIGGFYFRYNVWLGKKKRAFDIKKAQLEEESRRCNEWLETREKSSLQQQASAETSREESMQLSYEARKNSVLPCIDQQITQARDQIGVRWIRCEICGTVDTASEFSTYGGINHLNLGICRKCSKKQ